MTPHILLLTSAEEVGGPILIPIGNIAYAVPLDHTTRIFLQDRDVFLDVTEDFRTIVHTLGGLVMQPFRPWPVS